MGRTTNIGLKAWRHDSDEVFAQHNWKVGIGCARPGAKLEELVNLCSQG